MMKKITLFAVLALLCLNFRATAQDAAAASPAITGLHVGDKVPAAFWQTKSIFLDAQGKRFEQTLESFRGKFLIIDFWACWCGSCINHFNALSTLQANHPELAVIPVNTLTTRDTDARIHAIVSGKQYKHIVLSMPTIVADTTITQYFPHRGLPHYVWIDSKGMVQAITMSALLNETSLKAIIANTH